jgi:hypothetical protein
MLRIEVVGLMAEDAMQKGELDIYAKFQGKHSSHLHTSIYRLIACALLLLLA